MRKSFFFLSVLLVCGLLELGARLAQPWLESHVSFYYYRSILKALVLKNPELIWMGRPAAKALIRNPLGELIPYQQNSLGWRDEEFQLLRSPFNALVLGDSFSFGAGVRAEDRFSERLEKMFSGLDVWNLGVMGYAPDQELLLAQRWLPPVRWRFVILQLSNNDLADIAHHQWLGVHSSSGLPSAIGAPSFHSWVSEFSEAWNFLAHLLIQRRGVLSREELEAALPRLILSVRACARLARSRGIPLLLLLASDWGTPVYGPFVAESYRDSLLRLAKEEEFAVLEAGLQELLPAPDLHWTAAAHAKVAELLRPFVAQSLSAEPVFRKKRR